MNTLQNMCIDTIVQKGHPKPLNEILPRILCPTIINKIMNANKPKWEENIYLVHLDLLIKMGKLKFKVENNFCYLAFSYDYNCEYYFKIHGHTYNYLDKNEKKLFDTTIKYLKSYKLY